uniref:DUF4080 domain-containing protein n=1 Tax=Candidatus Magnetaquicoccus inordinatus TaxID=2496818 RepID=UPI00102C67A7
HQHLALGLFIHLEMVPDRLPQRLQHLLKQFPPGTLQFEVGIQSFNPEVQARIARPWHYQRTMDNLRWLVAESGVHLHTDLLIGLPGESLASFAAGFDQLLAINPHEIQVGILKRLRGAPIAQYSEPFAMLYNPDPPYDLLANGQLDFLLLRRLKRLARYWDLFGNSGRFRHVRSLFAEQESAFAQFLQLSDWLYASIGRTHAISLREQFNYLYRGLCEALGWPEQVVQSALTKDWQNSSLQDPPDCLRGLAVKRAIRAPAGVPTRQRRHLTHQEAESL